MSTDPGKVRAVREWPQPTTVTVVRDFLGLCSYYRRFVSGFADIVRPLHRLAGKGIDFRWTTECEEAF